MEQPVRERVLYCKHSGGNQSLFSRSLSCVLDGRSDNSMDCSSFFVQLFVFLVLFLSLFFIFIFSFFISFCSLLLPPLNSLLDAHIPLVNQTLTFILSLSCFFAKSTSCFKLVGGTAGHSQDEVDVRQKSSTGKCGLWEKSVDSLAAIRWDGDWIVWVLPIHAELY